MDAFSGCRMFSMFLVFQEGTQGEHLMQIVRENKGGTFRGQPSEWVKRREKNERAEGRDGFCYYRSSGGNRKLSCDLKRLALRSAVPVHSD